MIELTPDQKKMFERAPAIERLLASDDWPIWLAIAQEYSRQWLDGSAVHPDKSSPYCAGGAKAVLDFMDFLADIPRQKDAVLEESQREAGPKSPKPSMRVRGLEPADI